MRRVATAIMTSNMAAASTAFGIAKDGGTVDVATQTGIAEDGLDHHHAADEPVDVEHDDGDGRQQCIAQCMA
jgi:hypothetical protein